MKPLWAMLIAGAAVTGLAGCEEAGDSREPPPASKPILVLPQSAAAPLETPPPEPRGLTRNQRRVTIFVEPGDAVVEVEGKPTSRRDGVIELVGDVGRDYQVKAVSGPNVLTEKVKIFDVFAQTVHLDASKPRVANGGGGERRPVFVDDFHP